jgi:hypothetical protein
MAGHLLYKSSIAGAVAREISRGDLDGIAYKAELDRRGSDALQLCDDACRDAELMHHLTTSPE